MRVLHLSDLHLSRYGESGTWTPRDPADDAEVLHSWRGWQIEALRSRKRRRPDKIRLVDPEGVVHRIRSASKRDDKKIQALLSLAMERHRTSAANLIQEPLPLEDLQALLKVDPVNTNLRFIEMLEQVLRLDPELILLTGDTTDNGFGYQLVIHYLADWIRRGRFLVVPGNHDIYEMLPLRGRLKRRTAKGERYRRFAEEVGLEPLSHNAWLQFRGDIAFVGLDSCMPPRTQLSASGKVSEEQLRWLDRLSEDPDFRGARLRVALVHHHLLRMPFSLGKRNPIEMTMRLRNAPEVMQACRRAGIDLLFNGHRHHGYLVQLPDHPTVISSPSSTLGCKFARSDYVWLIDLAERHPYPVLHAFRGYRAQMGHAEPNDD